MFWDQRESGARQQGAARKAALKPPKAAEGPAAQRCLPSSLAAAQGCLCPLTEHFCSMLFVSLCVSLSVPRFPCAPFIREFVFKVVLLFAYS